MLGDQGHSLGKPGGAMWPQKGLNLTEGGQGKLSSQVMAGRQYKWAE